ncbi:hypothetical protein D3C80_1075590 [compost metagenome]
MHRGADLQSPGATAGGAGHLGAEFAALEGFAAVRPATGQAVRADDRRRLLPAALPRHPHSLLRPLPRVRPDQPPVSAGAGGRRQPARGQHGGTRASRRLWPAAAGTAIGAGPPDRHPGPVRLRARRHLQHSPRQPGPGARLPHPPPERPVLRRPDGAEPCAAGPASPGSDAGTLPARRTGGRRPGHAQDARPRQALVQRAAECAAQWRNRHRQGAPCPRAARQRQPAQGCLRRHQLRGDAGIPDRERAVRLPARNLHRSPQQGYARPDPAGRWRHPVPRRDRRHAAAPADPAVTCAGRAGGDAAGRREADQGQRPGGRRQPPRPASDDRGRAVPRRPVLPPERRHPAFAITA